MENTCHILLVVSPIEILSASLTLLPSVTYTVYAVPTLADGTVDFFQASAHAGCARTVFVASGGKTLMTGSVIWPISQVLRSAFSRDLRGIGGILMKVSFIFIACLWASQAFAQATYTATSCSESAVQAAISAEQVHPVDGDIIAIPACSATWTTGISQTFNNSVTLQGAGAVSATTGGASTTGTDSTVITTNANGPVFSFKTVSGKSFRFTGIALLENSSSAPASSGNLYIDGSSTALRVDHNHFYTYGGSCSLFITGSQLGVADHDYFESLSGSLPNDIRFQNGFGWNGGTSSTSWSSWADTEHWGSNEFFFVEDSRFYNGDISDGHDGARYVFRYNTVTGDGHSGQQMYNHGVTNANAAGVRAMEVYDNTFVQNGNNSNPPVSVNSGTILFWGNSVTGGYQYGIEVGYDFRTTAGGGGNYVYNAPPNGWGFCGSAAGGPTNWDGNRLSSGYPCLMQPGRGSGDLLTGANFPSIVNSTTGTVAWPHEALSPIYVWDNVYTPQYYTSSRIVGDNTAGSGSSILANNRDYYMQFGTLANSGSFNGTTGVGQGPLSARPSTCTAGTDPMTSASAPGVGYWATDTDTLYVCNPTNTWTAYYTPYTYPHPLTSGGAGAPVPPDEREYQCAVS